MVTTKDFMLCQSITETEALKLDNTRWKANFKYDGERIIAIVQKGDVILLNRRGKIKNEQFGEVALELSQLPDCILDGEVISKDNNFNKLQSRAATHDKQKLALKINNTPIDYMIFDILSLNGEMLMAEKLTDRVIQLQALFQNKRFSNLKLCVYGDIQELLAIAKANTMEGIIVKDMEAKYEARRSPAWLKLKLWKETMITIVKYTSNNAGIRAESKDGIAVQIAGGQSEPIKKALDAGKEVNVYIQYLEKTVENKLRFPSFRGVV